MTKPVGDKFLALSPNSEITTPKIGDKCFISSANPGYLPKKDQSCEVCSIKVSHAFAEIHTSAFSSTTKPLCSLECFRKYYNITSPDPKPHYIPHIKFKPPLPPLQITTIQRDVTDLSENTKGTK